MGNTLSIDAMLDLLDELDTMTLEEIIEQVKIKRGKNEQEKWR